MIAGGKEGRVDVGGLDVGRRGRRGLSFKTSTSFSRDFMGSTRCREQKTEDTQDTARATYMLSEVRRPKLIDW